MINIDLEYVFSTVKYIYVRKLVDASRVWHIRPNKIIRQINC